MNQGLCKRLNMAISNLELVASEVEAVRDEEQEKFDNMSEGSQNGDKGQAIEEGINNLTAAFDELESARGRIGDAIGN